MAKPRERTIHFFEIVRDGSPNPGRMAGQLGHAELLASLGGMPRPERRFATGEGSILYPEIRMSQDHGDQLVMLRLRTREDYETEVDTETWEVVEVSPGGPMQAAAGTIVYFIGFANLVAVVRSQTGPTIRHIEEYLTGCMPGTDGGRLILRALMSRTELRRLQSSDGASRLQVKVGVGGPSSNKREGLLGAIADLRARYPDATIELTVSTGRGRGKQDTKQAIRDSALALAESDLTLSKLETNALHYEPDEREQGEFLNMLEHALTAKTTFDDGDEGGALDLAAAVRAVERRVTSMESELRELTEDV